MSIKARRALWAAVMGAAALGLACPALHADSTWIDPNDPTGIGNDGNAATHLLGFYEDTAHWSPTGQPGSGANLLFDAPGYSATPYTVTLGADHTANQMTVNNPMTLDLGAHGLTLTDVDSTFDNTSLLIGATGSLTLRNGMLFTQSVQIGVATSATTGPAQLTVDGATLSVAEGGTIANYVGMQAISGGQIQLGDNVVLNQAPDFGPANNSTAMTLISGSNNTGSFSTLFLGDNDIVRGGILAVTNGGQVTPTGSTLTYDSLYYQGDIYFNLPLTLNLASTLFNPNTSTLIPMTITGSLDFSGDALNIINTTVNLTPDSGSTFTPFTIVGNTQVTISNSTLASGTMTFDGDGAPGTGSNTVIDDSNLTATASLWAGDIIVGELGNAAVTVQNGSALSADGTLYVGDQAGIIGSLALTGVGTSLIVGSRNFNQPFGMLIGNFGNGLMTVSGGASAWLVAQGLNVYVGVQDNADGTGGIGTLTVTGSGLDGSNNLVQSLLDISTLASGDLYIGVNNNAQGFLNITDGGLVQDVNGYVGAKAGSTGTALVDGHSTALSQWINSADLIIGDAGTGSLTVSNGAEIDVGLSMFVGNQAGSTGSVVISTGATIVVNGTGLPNNDLTIGGDGTGSLTINSSAVAYISNSIFIGGNPTGAGVVLVTDPGSGMIVTDEIIVGNFGAGSLTASNAAQLTDFVARIGSFPNSVGVVIIDNAAWTSAGFLNVGQSGSGSLSIRNGGTVTAADVNLAAFMDSTALVTVNGGLLTSQQGGPTDGVLEVGVGGAATLTIQGGGVVTNVTANVGVAFGATGLITVDGFGSAWNSSDAVTIGDAGAGTLTMTNNAAVTVGAALTIGSLPAGTGLVTVDHAQLGAATFVTVGSEGSGELDVRNGGAVSITQSITAGLATGSTGTVLVTGAGSALNSAFQMVVAADGSSFLTVSQGALLTAASGPSPTGSALIVGEEGTGVGTLTVTDPGSHITLAGHMVVGLGNNGASTTSGGTGILNVLNGALVTDINGYVGRYAGSTGIASISANGSWQNSGSLFIAANDTANNSGGQTLLAGAGTVTVGAGGMVSAAASGVIGAAGVLNMQGGTFAAPAMTLNGTLKGNGSVFGIMTGSGTVEADGPGVFTTDALRVNAINVTANATLALRNNSSYSKTNALSLAHSGAGSSAVYSSLLQLNNNRLVVQTADAPGKAAAILAINEALRAGIGTGNTWTGAGGITSSAVAADPQHLTIGVFDNKALARTNFAGGTNNVDQNSLIVSPALIGDANLDGIVNFNDMLAVTGNWNTQGLVNGISTIDFAHGDLNGDGIVNFNDMLVVTGHWNNSSSIFNLAADLAQLTSAPSTTPIPEPSSFTLLFLVLPLLLLRIPKSARAFGGSLSPPWSCRNSKASRRR